MEARGSLVEAVDGDRRLLVTQFSKVVAQDEGDRLGRIAATPVLAADRDAVGKGSDPSVAMVGGEIADHVARLVLDHEAEGIPFGFRRRLLLRPLANRLRRLREGD